MSEVDAAITELQHSKSICALADVHAEIRKWLQYKAEDTSSSADTMNRLRVAAQQQQRYLAAHAECSVSATLITEEYSRYLQSREQLKYKAAAVGKLYTYDDGQSYDPQLLPTAHPSSASRTATLDDDAPHDPQPTLSTAHQSEATHTAASSDASPFEYDDSVQQIDLDNLHQLKAEGEAEALTDELREEYKNMLCTGKNFTVSRVN